MFEQGSYYYYFIYKETDSEKMVSLKLLGWWKVGLEIKHFNSGFTGSTLLELS